MNNLLDILILDYYNSINNSLNRYQSPCYYSGIDKKLYNL